MFDNSFDAVLAVYQTRETDGCPCEAGKCEYYITVAACLLGLTVVGSRIYLIGGSVMITSVVDVRFGSVLGVRIDRSRYTHPPSLFIMHYSTKRGLIKMNFMNVP